MPTIARPTTGVHNLPYQPRGGDAITPNSIALRIRVAIHRNALTRELAAGGDPDASPERALRAAQLIGERGRRRLARTFRRTVAEARRPGIGRSVTIIQRGAVVDAEAAISALIARLSSPHPVQPAGMALAELIVSDSECSPLFNPTEPGSLARQVHLATAALDEAVCELPLAA